MSLVRVARRLARETGALRFGPPVAHVYNPLEYASRPHEQYLRRFGKPGCEALMLGMNPGPYGMVQTGVPFGEVALVRDWMGIEAKVDRPSSEHPKRPVQGFECTRSEVSGRRLWGWAQERYGAPEAFFEHFFVWNYCPLAFLEEGGRNRTPDKLPVAERDALYAVCDESLRSVVRFLKPRLVIGVGAFAETRARLCLDQLEDVDVDFGRILHPSPASPLANRGWSAQAEQQLEALGVGHPR